MALHPCFRVKKERSRHHDALRRIESPCAISMRSPSRRPISTVAWFEYASSAFDEHRVVQAGGHNRLGRESQPVIRNVEVHVDEHVGSEDESRVVRVEAELERLG
jgi:hypothetical protein